VRGFLSTGVEKRGFRLPRGSVYGFRFSIRAPFPGAIAVNRQSPCGTSAQRKGKSGVFPFLTVATARVPKSMRDFGTTAREKRRFPSPHGPIIQISVISPGTIPRCSCHLSGRLSQARLCFGCQLLAVLYSRKSSWWANDSRFFTSFSLSPPWERVGVGGSG
jgi:hypothetical protein